MALHQAASYGKPRLCELLLRQGAPVTSSLLKSSPLFELALCSPSPFLVNKLVSARCAVDELVEMTVDSTVVKKWLGPKPVAAHHMFRCLVRAQHGMTALMVASVADNGKVAQEFLEADADPGMRNKAGSTASDMANMGHLRSLVRPRKQRRSE